ncbi:hypothetical protein B0H15DRAFT_442935 [Mycena belliarum]|uniref:Uncharacterized protein n=1 Tax=Mycena belliarum TaxID=1033014 RepID=A0AAD6TYE4_9AGAR|nr:hypothetical protein B0H15DRAFT_442935 [Mycena belliae]
MSRSNTPYTARPDFARPTFCDDGRTPTAADFPVAGRFLSVPQAPQTRRSSPALPQNMWKSIPNLTVEGHQEKHGKSYKHERGGERPGLNPRAPVYRPGSALSSGSASAHLPRPSSSLSSHSSTSSATSAYAFSASSHSSSTDATSASSPGSCAPSRDDKSHIDLSSITDPGERAYLAYRERVVREPSLAAPMQCILETAADRADLAHEMARLGLRLSQHARGGAVAFLARLRADALALFHDYWKPDGAWRSEHSAPASRGVNISGLIGALFHVRALSAADVHGCLAAVLSPAPGPLKLRAAHAMIVHCGAEICVGDAARGTAGVRRALGARGPEGYYVWGPQTESRALLKVRFVCLTSPFG